MSLYEKRADGDYIDGEVVVPVHRDQNPSCERMISSLERLANSWTARGRGLSAHGDWPTGEAYQDCASELRNRIRGGSDDA